MAAQLPLAPDRAVLSNRIALLLSTRASLLKTLNPPSARRPDPPPRAPLDDDGEDLKYVQPNQGVGYVPAAKDGAGAGEISREHRALLGKKRKGGGVARAKGRQEEEEEDEDEGRSGVGRRKRVRRGAEDGAEAAREGEISAETASGAGDLRPRDDEGRRRKKKRKKSKN